MSIVIGLVFFGTILATVSVWGLLIASKAQGDWVGMMNKGLEDGHKETNSSDSCATTERVQSECRDSGGDR